MPTAPYIETAPFTVSRKRTVASMARMGQAWIWAISLLVVAALIVGITYDVRWAIVGLMGLFIAIPMLGSMLYIYYGLRPESFVNVTTHRARFIPSGVEIDTLTPLDADNSESETVVRTYKFQRCTTRRYGAGTDSLRIPVGNPCRGELIVPYDSFASPDDLKDAISLLLNK